jgi:RNA polymerase sigma-70 factor (ECF subfamily)
MADPHAPDELTPDELRRLPGRDEAVLGRFFDVWFGRVYGFVRRMVADEHLAEDLTQEVFAHVYKALATYDPARELRPWLFAIATNKVRDHWRSRRHRDAEEQGALESDEGRELVPGRDAPPDAGLARAELGREVRRAIDELPERMRVALVLRAYEGLSFEEIGQVQGRNEVAVRKRYSRALEALRGRLEAVYRLHAEGP